VTDVTRKTTVVFEVTVTAGGKVGKVQVLQGSRNTGLLERTIVSIRSWRFERLPASRKGVSERCRVTVTYRPPT